MKDLDEERGVGAGERVFLFLWGNSLSQGREAGTQGGEGKETESVQAECREDGRLPTPGLCSWSWSAQGFRSHVRFWSEGCIRRTALPENKHRAAQTVLFSV